MHDAFGLRDDEQHLVADKAGRADNSKD